MFFPKKALFIFLPQKTHVPSGQGWDELKNEFELFNLIPEFELKDFHQAEFELKDFE